MIYNLDAEQYFIGAIILEPELAKEKTVHSDMFSDRHRIIMQAIEKCIAKEIESDLVAIVTELGNNVENIGGITYLSQLAGAIPTTANLKHYERFIIDSYKLRKAYESATEFVQSATGHPDPILINKLAQEITTIQESHNAKEKESWRDTLVGLVDDAYTEQSGLTGVDTGFHELNRMTDGLQGNNLIILGARPSMGKTAFALNIGSNACMMQDARVDIFSLETPKKRLAKRIISATGNINAEYMRRMEFPDDRTRDAFMKTVGLVDGYDLHIHDGSSVTVEEIRSVVAEGNRQAKKEGKKHVVIIDYLQLINYVGPITGYVQQIGHISRSLKVMASDFDIPVIALSQLSRGVEQRQDKRPMMSDIRESGNIEQDADIIAFMYRDDYYDKESEMKNITEIIIAKNRDGAVGTINLAFIKEYNKFVNLETRYDHAS